MVYSYCPGSNNMMLSSHPIKIMLVTRARSLLGA